MDNRSPLPALLDRLGVSQAELGRRLDLGRSTINMWCSVGVPAERITGICEALKLDAVTAADFAREAGFPLYGPVEEVVRGAVGGSHAQPLP